MNLGKSWDVMSAAERAIFVSHLMYEPNREKLRPVTSVISFSDWKGAFQALHDLSEWCNRAEDWLERAAISKADERAARNRSVWSKRP